MTFRELTRKCDISISYLHEIENGKKRPPNNELINKIVEALKLGYNDRCVFYDLAADERGEVSADLVGYIMSNDDVRKALRAEIKQIEEDKT